MNNNANNEQELRMDNAVCTEAELCFSEGETAHDCDEMVMSVEDWAAVADSPEGETAEQQASQTSEAQEDSVEAESGTEPEIEPGNESGDESSADPDTCGSGAPEDDEEPAVRSAGQEQSAGTPQTPREEKRKTEQSQNEDYFSPIERIFASRPPREDPEPERYVFSGSRDDATVSIRGNEKLLRWLIDGMADGSVDVTQRTQQKNESTEASSSRAKKKENKRGKVFSTFLCLLLSLLVMGGIAYYVLCAHSLRAIVSIHEVEVNANVYSMTYSGSYGLGDLIAQGGVSTDRELMDFLSRKFSFGLVDMPDIVSGSAGGSDGVLSVLNSDCDNGRALTGRSHSCQSQTMTMIVSTRRSDGRETVTTVDIGRLGYTPYNRPGLFNGYAALAAVYLPLDGMNDHGLCVTAVELPGDPKPVMDTGRPDLTVTAAVRTLLDYTATVEDAVGMLGKFDIYPSFGCDHHLLISDREGNAAAIEWHDGQMYRVNIPYISNERVYSPDGFSGAAGFDTETGRIMTLLAGSYSKYDGHMTTEQMLGVIGRAATRAGGWGVVYDPYTDTAYFRFEGETEKQVTVSMSPA